MTNSLIFLAVFFGGIALGHLITRAVERRQASRRPTWQDRMVAAAAGVRPSLPNMVGILQVRPLTRRRRFLNLFRRKWSPFGADGRIRPEVTMPRDQGGEGWYPLGGLREGDR